MKQTEFIRILVARSGICEPTVRQVLRTTKDLITDAMVDGDEIIIKEFGSFRCKRHRQRHNGLGCPYEGMPDTFKPSLHVSRVFRDRVNARRQQALQAADEKASTTPEALSPIIGI